MLTVAWRLEHILVSNADFLMMKGLIKIYTIVMNVEFAGLEAETTFFTVRHVEVVMQQVFVIITCVWKERCIKTVQSVLNIFLRVQSQLRY